MKNPIFEYITALLCINCGSSAWTVEPSLTICRTCGHCYPITQEGKLITVGHPILEGNWETVSDGFELIKGDFKPIKVDKLGGPRISDLPKALGVTGLAINFGSGQDNYPGYINMDLGAYAPVHIVADLTKVPLVDNSVELLVSNSVIEHIYDYKLVIDEAVRIIKKGGYFYLCVPNACLRHHKFDYHRWTSPGLRNLFLDKFEIIDSGACRGIAYSLITYVETLISYKVRNRLLLSMIRSVWRVVSYPLFWIKDDKSDLYQAMSQTIYILGKKI